MKFRSTFLTGLLIVLPAFVTFWLLALFFGVIDGTVTPMLFRAVRLFGPSAWVEQAWVNYIAPVLGVFISVLVVYVVGLFGGNVFGRQMLKWLESLLLRVPLVRGVYTAMRQLIGTFSGQDGRAFSGVVLVEFPRSGVWTLGLVTGTTQGEVARRLNRDLLNVFVPTTPNPTGGYLIFVPSEAVIRVDMSIDDAFKIIISGGVLTPEAALAQPGAAAAVAIHSAG